LYSRDGRLHLLRARGDERISGIEGKNRQGCSRLALNHTVLDLVRPMLFIWQESNDPRSRAAVKTAIRLLAHAHFFLTALRRKNVLKQTHSKFLAMLKKDKYFSD
jgi:hypothetical protein